MASSFFSGSLAISRDETSGNNLDVDQLNVIDPAADLEARSGQVPQVPSPDRKRHDYSSSEDSSSQDEDDSESDVIISVKRYNRYTTPRYQELPQPRWSSPPPPEDLRARPQLHSARGGPSRNIPNGPDGEAHMGREPSIRTDGVRRSSFHEDLNDKRAVLVVRDKNKADPIDETSALRAELEALRAENIRMRQSTKDHGFRAQPAKPAATYKTFYRIEHTHYLDEPHWEPGDGTAILSSKNPIRNFNDYVEQHPDIAFAVIKEYDPQPPVDRSKIERGDGAYRKPEPLSQVLLFISDAMIEAVEDFVDHVPEFHVLFPKFNPRRRIKAPYMFMFHSAQFLPDILMKVDPPSRYLLTRLEQCIRKSHGFEHDSARARAKEGRVSNDLFGYLIQPGDVLVRRAGPLTEAYIALDWAQESGESQNARRDGFRYDEWSARHGRPTAGWDVHKEEEIRTFYEWTVPVWSWSFDGSFQRRRDTLELGVEASYSSELVPIEQLAVMPLRFTPPNVRTQLENRGEMFWSLRHGRFVSCQKTKGSGLDNVADRFMVDVETYKKLHPKSRLSTMKLTSSLSYKEMESDEPPQGDSLLLFPPQIPGFDLSRKMWVDLYVDYMSVITWNKQAFEDLVVDNETKELVKALVMKQLDTSQSTDFIAGKGNGLIVLLHGGPGTGKTFTAEGVAEFAEKPLLRVTCGDVGTVAEVVEKKLQSSFHLGKIWDCVVLLDEADVFLEERDMKDLNRNALVSVFLRELEYYDGILILTSNRVGTFDEAFKSRIQLSLHYENLGPSQRRKIWRNFINRVKVLDPTIDYEDILDHLDELSKVDMNGREIRNTITTARQFAHFKDEKLGYSHLNHVLRVNGKFGRYLNDLRDGLTEDEVKRDSGLRLSYRTSNSRHKESPF